jgi:hypothetical protein
MTTNVLNLPGDYKIVVNGTDGLVTVAGDTQLGASPSNTIDAVAEFVSDLIPQTSSTYNFGTPEQSWNTAYLEKGRFLDGTNVENRFNRPYNPLDIYDIPEHRNTASVYILGGLGVEKDINVGGFIYGRIETANTALSILTTVTNADFDYFPTLVFSTSDQQIVFVDNDGVTGGLRYNPYYGKLKTDRVFVAETDLSISTETGALVVAGGVGIAGTMTIGGDILPAADITGKIGHTSTQWAEAYVHDIYTRVLASTTGSIEVKPYDGMTDVFGDIRVRGTNPIGTAPVVTNVLYVTVDGNDTNDGRAQDASRACRTIGAALNSPYYQPGTQILVSAGHYYEDNPLRLKPYTSIRGSDIRTTFIEPINKTQDLFHLESGCYLNYMTFLNGRSGLLQGQYALGYNRGAYATAFPPQTGDNRIDLFHSPYVQNCTNQSGPWLKDGTMFIPNQTVQVPKAIGTGTWVANTTTIEVTAQGTITQGMSINAGQQNVGFFSARTLLLANKPFLQEQTVLYVNDTYPGFDYNREKCRRDVGILVENISYDAAFGGNEKAVESGLSYWQGVVSLIAGQEVQTNAAIEFLRDRMLEVITNTPCTIVYAGVESQVINIVLTGGGISTDSITNLVSTITNIITNGPDVAPAVYKSTGPDAAFVSAEILMQANRKFIQEDTINYINSIIYDTGTGGFPYSEIKCRRDTGLIVDSIIYDLLYDGTTQSNFAGIQYWNQSGWTGAIESELSPTISSIRYLKDLSVKIIKNITSSDDLIGRFGVADQPISLESATTAEADVISPLFTTMINIINGTNKFWTDSIIPNGSPSDLLGVQNAVALLQENKTYIANEISAYIQAPTSETHGAFTGLNFSAYDDGKCRRDVGYIIDCISFDLLNGGNRQSIQAAVYYLGFAEGNGSSIAGQIVQTTGAFNYLSTIAQEIIQNVPIATLRQNKVKQNLSLDVPASAPTTALNSKVVKLNSIIDPDFYGAGDGGLDYTDAPAPISLTITTDDDILKACEILKANRQFIVEEVIAYIDQTYNPGRFNYDEALCYRDTGLIVDAVSQDILLGGNSKSVEAGLAYWNFGYNQVAGQETTTTMAINYARDIALQIIANETVTPQSQTTTPQVINTFFQYGGDYMPQEAVTRNFGIITDIIERGPLYAPPIYSGGGLFSLTGLNGSDVKISPTVTSVQNLGSGKYKIGLSGPTIGFGTNATLYFGDTLIYPLKDSEIETLSLEYTGDSTTWNQRKVDPIGSMGGSLVDGGVISVRSPIQSFVYDAFTQVNQGGRGVHITNDGYAQLVSVFTIFCSIGVQTDNGGIASIVNSNANFGDICLLSKGYGKRKFSGTIYNPAFKAYPESPGPDGFDQYYPNGFWPNNGRVEIFLPEIDDRPHISLVMEVVPPEGHKNEQAFPGFLNASPNTGTLISGTITLTGIDTTGISIGNSVYARDQFGYEYDHFEYLYNQFGEYVDINGNVTTDSGQWISNPNYGIRYLATGTVVTDVGYQSVVLNFAVTGNGSDPGNTVDSYNNNYFDLYFCGNAYYTVLSSEIAKTPNDTPVGFNILSTLTNVTFNQVPNHISALGQLNDLVNAVISNTPITPNVYNTTTVQIINNQITNGVKAGSFIDLRFDEMITIINAPNLAAAEAVRPPSTRTKTGPDVQGGGSAITLIQLNLDFLADEIVAYTLNELASPTYDTNKCRRDVKLILQRLIYDIETGGRYNSVMIGLSYWSRSSTYHVVQLGENLTRTDLLPDGTDVNFYQRSYISASGYVFEYVGAGTNYGALPQRGVADPVQGKEVVQLDAGKVFFTSTDQNGDFRIGPGLVISQATGVLSGRTFTKSLFANMTPFILAIEGGGGLG